MSIDPVLALALVNAQREVKVALKGSTNSFHNYKYASAEEVLIVGREALNSNGLGLFPASEDFEPIQPIDDKCGGAVALIRCKWNVVHESGAVYEFSTDVPVVPERGRSSGWSRPADKAAFGARTEALGYALRDLLNIPRQDAPDVSGRHEKGRAGPGTEEQQEQRQEARKNPKRGAEQYLVDMQTLKEYGKLDQCLTYARRDVASELLAPIEAEFARKLCVRIAASETSEDLEKVAAYAARLAIRGDAGEKIDAEIASTRAKFSEAPA